MSSVIVTVGGHTVSNDTVDIDIWMNKKTSVGASSLKIDNTGDQWGDDFEPNDDVNISINGVLMFVGKVDDVVPYLDKKGVKTNYIKVKSRDAGRYLIDYYHTEDHGYERSGAIIDAILAGVGDPLLYTDPGGTPYITYNSQRTKLVDAFKDISDLSGYDRYIDTNGRLQFFDAGTVSSTVALKSVADAVDNNLLDFEEYEEIGNDIKNYIEVHAGSVKDHWSNGNSGDWSDLLGGGTTFSDEATVNIFGAYSVKVIASDNDETFGLDFSGGLYSQGTTVDMSAFAQNKVLFRHDDASTGSFSLIPYLKDSSGNEIEFTRNQSGAGSKGYTTDLETLVDQWRTLSYQTGEHTDNVVLANPTSGRWSGDTAFDWSSVEDIGFRLITGVGMNTIYITGWYMPSVEVKSIAQDAASIAAYGKRMYSEYRKDLKSQNELDAESVKMLSYKKDPLQKFKATAIGQTGTKYAAQTVTVQAPDYGIAGATTYVIQSLHHILHNDSNTRGWDFITKYELALSDVDSTRVLSDDNPTEALLLKMAKENRGFKGSQTDDEYYLGDIITGITPQLTNGTVQPTDANEGDRFYDTDLDIEYEYTGGVWVPIVLSSAALDISIQPWTSNFSLIWDDKDDEPPTDYNHFKWGSLGNENTADATIAYGDGTTVDVNFGEDTGVGNGVWWVYWDESQKTGGDYDVQWTQVYGNASGNGKGVLAQVFVDNATPDSPSVLMYNSYTPTIGAGSIVAHAIRSVHIDADFITGKSFRSAAGTTNVEFTNSGIIGQNAGVTQFSLSAADGKAYFAAGKAIIDTSGITWNDTTGNAITFNDDAGTTTYGYLRTSASVIRLDRNGGGRFALLASGNVEAVSTADLILTGGDDITMSAADDVTISGDMIILDAGSGAGEGVKLVGGTSYVEVDYGNTDVTIHADDDVFIDADDAVTITATAGDMQLTAGGNMDLDPTGTLDLSPSGGLLINGLATFSGIRTWDDETAGVQHSVTVSKGIIRSWTVT